MASGLRERKRDGSAKTDLSTSADEDYVKQIEFKEQTPADLEPDFKVVVGLILAFAAVLGTFFYYKVNNRPDTKGPFAAWVNTNIVPVLKKMSEPFMPKNRYQQKMEL